MEYLIGLYLWVALCTIGAIYDGETLEVWQKALVVLLWPLVIPTYAIKELISD